jgi:hypothetical protein
MDGLPMDPVQEIAAGSAAATTLVSGGAMMYVSLISPFEKSFLNTVLAANKSRVVARKN